MKTYVVIMGAGENCLSEAEKPWTVLGLHTLLREPVLIRADSPEAAATSWYGSRVTGKARVLVAELSECSCKLKWFDVCRPENPIVATEVI